MKQLGKYQLRSIIGQGAMGVVYEAFDPEIERVVALKVLHPHLVAQDQGPALVERFKQEVKAAARCHHPNIVTVFDFGIAQGAPFMVMEYVAGIDLRSLLKQGESLSVQSAGDIALQVLEALDYAHQSGVVHRDVKPANVMLLDNGRVKVTDFGVARIDTSELTSLGDVIGTPIYMSPEALRGDKVDGRSDLYAVALMLLELLARRRPTTADGRWPRSAIEAMLAESGALPPERIAAFGAVLEQALRPDPGLRLADARRFIEALKTVLAPGQVYVAQTDDLAATVCRSRSAIQQAHPLPDTSPSQSGAATGSASLVLSAELSAALNRSLAPFLGPITSRIIRNAAATSPSLDAMIERLSQQIPSDAERRNFLRQVESSGVRLLSSGINASQSGASRSGAATPASGYEPGAEELALLTRQLAFHVGPLATRLVKLSLPGARDRADLVTRLAERIPDPKEREQFCRACAG